jgi:hypothetical protein
MLAGVTASASATTIGTITTADNLVFTLSYDPSGVDLNSDGNTDDYLYTLTLNSSGYTGSDSQYIAYVSPNLAQHDAEDLVTQPGGGSDWSDQDGGANNGNGQQAGGCNGQLASGKVCSQTGSTAYVLDGSTYTWQWILDTTGDPVIDAPHLQAEWLGPDGDKTLSDFFVETGGTGGTNPSETGGTNPSETGGEVPEPTSLLLLGTGLAGAALKLRKKA